MIDDPLALRNLKKGTSPGSISGMEFLLRYHKCATHYRPGNESHPLRMTEQADTKVLLRNKETALVAVATAAASGVKTYAKKRVKREAHRPDADGRYRL